jgi:hypothetical protein
MFFTQNAGLRHEFAEFDILKCMGASTAVNGRIELQQASTVVKYARITTNPPLCATKQTHLVHISQFNKVPDEEILDFPLMIRIGDNVVKYTILFNHGPFFVHNIFNQLRANELILHHLLH